MINQKFMKLMYMARSQYEDVHISSISSFPRIMSLKVVFQKCFGSIKMIVTRGY